MNLSAEQSQWLTKADILRLFSLCFSYPDKERVEAILDLSGELSSTGILPEAIRSVLAYLQSLPSARQLQRMYARLFIQGGIPLSETAYHPSNDIYSALAIFYQVFGLQPAPGDAPDTLPYELEFAGILALKVALAKDDEQREVAREAFNYFLSNHLIPLAVGVYTRLKETGRDLFYTQLAEHLKAFLEAEQPEHEHPVYLLNVLDSPESS